MAMFCPLASMLAAPSMPLSTDDSAPLKRALKPLGVSDSGIRLLVALTTPPMA